MVFNNCRRFPAGFQPVFKVFTQTAICAALGHTSTCHSQNWAIQAASRAPCGPSCLILWRVSRCLSCALGFLWVILPGSGLSHTRLRKEGPIQNALLLNRCHYCYSAAAPPPAGAWKRNLRHPDVVRTDACKNEPSASLNLPPRARTNLRLSPGAADLGCYLWSG